MDNEIGTGWGIFVQGPQASMDKLQSGDFLLAYSKQFNAKNVVRVLRRDQTGMNRPLVYGFFVNPEDPDELRHMADREFCIWEHDLPGEYFEAIRP